MRTRRVANLRVGEQYQLLTHHVGEVLVTLTHINPNPSPRICGIDGRWDTTPSHLGRVYDHTQKTSYPVNVHDLYRVQ